MKNRGVPVRVRRKLNQRRGRPRAFSMHTPISSPIVLMYHGIVSNSAQSPAGRETGAELYDVGEKDFVSQMEFLKTNRFAIGDWGSLASVVSPDRKAIITFDDGEMNNFSIAYPVLKKCGFPAYFFITASRVGKPGYLDWKHLTELHNQGMRIGSHGLTHEILTAMTDKNLLHELTESKRILETGLNDKIFSLSIPRGFYNDRVLKAAAEAGYKEIYVSRQPQIDSDHCIGRVAVKGSWTLNRFKMALQGQTPLLETIFVTGKDFTKGILGATHYNNLRSKLLKSRP